MISEFLNVMLDSLLPVDSITILSDFLQLTDASTNHTDRDSTLREHPMVNATRCEVERNEMANAVLSSISLCENALLRAEKQSLLSERMSKLSQSNAVAPLSGTLSTHVDTDHPRPASNLFRDAMHSALMAVMEERDEAHARMLSAEVLHVHEMEQQRKITGNLTAELELLKESVLRKKQSETKNGAETARKVDRQYDSDAELVSLCQQLAGEISARTSASLEIIRLKEGRKIEQENEAIEKKALKNEISQLRQELARERKRSYLARRESGSWRESFHEAVNGSESASNLQSSAHELAAQKDSSEESGR